MIIKRTTGSNGGGLAAYLLKEQKRDRDKAELIELRGFGTDDLCDALKSIDLEASKTRCKEPIYHVSFRPDHGEHLTPEQWEDCINRLEHRLGLDDQARAVVMHEHEGEQHLHVVWSRIDRENNKAVELIFDKERCTEIAREIEREYGLRELAPSHERTQEPLTRNDYEQARRTGRDPEEIREVKDQIREAWEHSDNGASFQNALSDAGLILARDDKTHTRLVVVDECGKPHGLARTVDEKTKNINSRLADLDRDLLPTAKEARGYQQEQQRQHEQAKAEREAEQKECPTAPALDEQISAAFGAEIPPAPTQEAIEFQQAQQKQAEREALQKARDIEFIKNYGVAAFKELDQNRARIVDGYKVYDAAHLAEMAQEAAQQNQQEHQQQARDPNRYNVLKYEGQQQEQTQEDPAPVMTPEQFKDQAHTQTPEETKAKRKAAQIEAIREAWEQSENGIEFALNLGNSEFTLARTEKEDEQGNKTHKWFKAVHISGTAYSLTPELLKEKGYNDLKEKLAEFIETPSLLDTVEQAREFWQADRAKSAQAREDAAATKAEERRDAADARAGENGHQGILNTRAVIREAWEQSENGIEFAEKIQEMGWEVALSEKTYSPYTVVDHKGKALDVAFTLGQTGKAITEALQDLDPADLRTVKEVQTQARATAAEVTKARTEGQDWNHWHNVQRGEDRAEREQARKPDITPDREEPAPVSASRAITALGDTAAHAIGGVAQFVETGIESLFCPPTPAEQKKAAREFDARRYYRDQAYRAEIKEARERDREERLAAMTREEREREKERQRQRERERERERDRER